MNEAAVGPPGVIPIQQPIAALRSSAHPVARQAGHGAQHLAPLDLRGHRLGVHLLLDRDQQLADAEQAHDRDDEIDAL